MKYKIIGHCLWRQVTIGDALYRWSRIDSDTEPMLSYKLAKVVRSAGDYSGIPLYHLGVTRIPRMLAS